MSTEDLRARVANLEAAQVAGPSEDLRARVTNLEGGIDGIREDLDDLKSEVKSGVGGIREDLARKDERQRMVVRGLWFVAGVLGSAITVAVEWAIGLFSHGGGGH